MLTDCTTEQSEQETTFEPISNVFISNSNINTDRQHQATTEATHGYDQHSSPMHEIHPARGFASPQAKMGQRKVLVSAKGISEGGTPTQVSDEAMNAYAPSGYNLRSRKAARQLEFDAQSKDESFLIIIDDDYPLNSFTFQQTNMDNANEHLSVFLSNLGTIEQDTPINDRQADESKYSAYWAEARSEELEACRTNNTWGEPVQLPKGKQSVNLGFVYALKDATNNSPMRFKARLVYKNHPFANTSTWDEVFAPVVDKSTLRIFFTLVGRKGLKMRQADVITAYLNADMTDEVFVKLPTSCGDEPGMVRQLLKALYGHPKAGQLWNQKFVQFMTTRGFIQSERDKCFFYNLKAEFFLVLYVDDLIAAALHVKQLNRFWGQLQSVFKVRDMGEPKHFLGMEISHILQHGLVAISQRIYVEKLAKRFELPDTERPLTPIRTDYYERLTASADEPILQHQPYKELVGALIFVMVSTRPDIAFAVSCLTTHFSSPKSLHWETANTCLGY